MKNAYERAKLNITVFRTEDVIATSEESTTPVVTNKLYERENKYVQFNDFVKAPGNWF